MTPRSVPLRRFAPALLLLLLSLPALVAWAHLPRWLGARVELGTRPRDPWDPLRGQYMVVRIDLGELDCQLVACPDDLGDHPGRSLYAELAPEGGLHRARRLAASPPPEPYLELRDWQLVSEAGRRRVTFDDTLEFFFEEGGEARYTPGPEEHAVLVAHVWRGSLRAGDLILRRR